MSPRTIGEWIPRAGDRVRLSVLHPDKRLDFGEDRGPGGEWAHARICNGAVGRIALCVAFKEVAFVTFDALGDAILVGVPLAWLTKW